MNRDRFAGEARTFGAAGAVLGALAVVAGAFGAHALRDSLDAAALAVFETAARYQMYHALALLVVAVTSAWRSTPLLRWAGWSFIGGVVIFSGSLYLLVFTGVPWWGAVTPVGGVALIAGWLLLVGAWVGRSSSTMT